MDNIPQDDASAPGSAAFGQGVDAAPFAGRAGPSLPPRPQRGAGPGSSATPSTQGPASAASPASGSPSVAPAMPAGRTSMPTLPPRSNGSVAVSPASAPAPGGAMVTGGGPSLPPRQAIPVSGPVLDPDEPEDIKQVRRRIHDVRVALIRAAQRLGYDAENALVRQVLYRLALAEKLKAPWRRAARRPDPAVVAAREAARLEAAPGGGGEGGGGQAAPQDLGFCVRMMLVGLAGTGKTQLIHSLLDAPLTATPPSSQDAPAANGGPGPSQGSGTASVHTAPPTWPAVDPISGATQHTRVYKGTSRGIPVEICDTPGLQPAAAGTAQNAASLQAIRRAYRSFKPDLVVYVDRLDAGGSARWGGELPALQGLSGALVPGVWLNTIVALTHAGSHPPMGPRGVPVAWDQWAGQRSQALQQVIRAASGDNRLMNPTAFVESHPNARRDAGGGPVLFNGMAWQPHLLLMVVSAKLLSDTEGMLQMQDGQGDIGGSGAAQQQLLLTQMMGGAPRTLPLPYLCTQATQFSQPLKYPDHDQVMAVRQAELSAQQARDPRTYKAAVRQAKGMRLQIKQANQYKEKMARSFRSATLAGAKVTPEPPRLATKRPPSAHPPSTYRYRVPEPAGGWVVRPTMEPHGMDVGDGIEGLQMEQYTVWGRHPDRPPPAPSHKNKTAAHTNVSPAGAGEGAMSVELCGVPMHHFLSAQATKQQILIQGRSEATLYHDPLGDTTTSLSADMQTSGAPGAALDALVSLRADLRRKAVPLLPGGSTNRATAGVLLTRLAEGGRLDRGPLAVGVRLQHSARARIGRRAPPAASQLAAMLGRGKPVPAGRGGSEGLPVELGGAVTLLAAPWGCTSHATAASLAAMGGGPPASVDPEVCIGGNVELTTETQHLLGTSRSSPLTLNANLVSYRGDLMGALATSLQVRGKGRDMCAARLQVSNKGKAGISLKLRSGPWWWTGLVAAAVPLTNLLRELRTARKAAQKARQS